MIPPTGPALRHFALLLAALTPLLVACTSNTSGPQGDGSAATQDTSVSGGPAAPIEPAPLTLHFQHHFSGAPLSLGESYDLGGTSYAFDTLRYWITAVKLRREDGSWHEVPSAYYLVEQTPARTRTSVPLVDLPAGVYTAVSYDVGVDEEHNHNLDMFEGELEAGIDMDWGWNSGFIFLKTEGAWSGGMTFAFHIGTDTNLRTVQHTLSGPTPTDDTSEVSVTIAVDLSSLFETFDVSAHHFVTFSPEDKATEVIENFISGHTLTAP